MRMHAMQVSSLTCTGGKVIQNAANCTRSGFANDLPRGVRQPDVLGTTGVRAGSSTSRGCKAISMGHQMDEGHKGAMSIVFACCCCMSTTTLSNTIGGGNAQLLQPDQSAERASMPNVPGSRNLLQ